MLNLSQIANRLKIILAHSKPDAKFSEIKIDREKIKYFGRIKVIFDFYDHKIFYTENFDKTVYDLTDRKITAHIEHFDDEWYDFDLDPDYLVIQRSPVLLNHYAKHGTAYISRRAFYS